MGFFDWLNSFGTVTIDGKVYAKHFVRPPSINPTIKWYQEGCNNVKYNQDLKDKKTKICVSVWYDPTDINLPRNTDHDYETFVWEYSIRQSRNSNKQELDDEYNRRKQIVTDFVNNWLQKQKEKGRINFSDISVTFQPEYYYSGDGYYF